MPSEKVASRCVPLEHCGECPYCRQVFVYTGDPVEDVRKTIEPHMTCTFAGENWELVDEYRAKGTPEWCPLPKFEATLDYGVRPMRWKTKAGD